ncbi:MAG TPA: TolC family protein [bacterium]|nr:TolC family protein [bacterium]
MKLGHVRTGVVAAAFILALCGFVFNRAVTAGTQDEKIYGAEEAAKDAVEDTAAADDKSADTTPTAATENTPASAAASEETQAAPAETSDTAAAVTEPSAPAATPEAAANDVEALLNEGKKFYRDSKYDEAIEAWNKVLAIDPNNKKALRYIERAESKKAPAVSEEVTVEGPQTVSPGILEIPPQIIGAPMTAPEEEIPAAPLEPDKKADYTALSLKDCVTIALANHKPARISLEEVLIARMKVTEAKRGLYPSVSIKEEEIEGRVPGGGMPPTGQFRGREFATELQQPLYQGGRIINTVRQSQINLAVAVKNYDKMKDDYTFEVEQAFFALANAKNVVSDLEELQAEAAKDLESILAQQKIGTAREVDVLNIQSQHDDINFQLQGARNDLELAKMTLAQLMNFENEAEFEIAGPPRLTKADYESLEIDLEECIKLAYQNRSDFYVKEMMVQFNKYGVEIAKSKGRLKVDLTGSYGLKAEQEITQKLDMQKEYFVGLKGSLPIGPHTLEESFINQDKAPSAGQTTSNQFESATTTLRLFDNFATMGVAQAQISYHKALDEMYKGRKALDFEVKKAYFDFKKATLNLDGYLAKIRLGEEEAKISKSQYDLNQATLADLLRTKVKSNEYRAGFGQASVNYYTSICKINKAIGVSGYFDPVTGRKEATLLDQNISKRRFVSDKSKISNYAAELSRAEKICQSVKPEEKWWEIWEKDETAQSQVKDRWWETWEKDTATGVVRPKNMWWMPWSKGQATAPRSSQRKWWQAWDHDSVSHSSLADSPFQSSDDRKPFRANPEDLVSRDMVKQLFQGNNGSKQ